MENKKTIYHFENMYLQNPLRFGDIYLIQIGRRFCSATETIAEHPHLNWFELTLISGGKGVVITNQEITRVKSGDIYLSFPCDVHEIRADEESKLEYDFLSFYCEDKTLSKELKNITQRFRGGDSRIFKDERVFELVNSAIAEFSNKGQLYSEQLLTDIFRLILIYLIRDFSNVKQQPKGVSQSEVLCYQLMSYIDTHIYSLQNLKDLADKFNYNYSYLSKLFKRTTGKTVLDYLRERKMQIAKTLLLEKKKKVSEIAEMLGYNLYSFSKSFKATFGISPKNIQKL